MIPVQTGCLIAADRLVRHHETGERSDYDKLAVATKRTVFAVTGASSARLANGECAFDVLRIASDWVLREFGDLRATEDFSTIREQVRGECLKIDFSSTVAAKAKNGPGPFIQIISFYFSEDEQFCCRTIAFDVDEASKDIVSSVKEISSWYLKRAYLRGWGTMNALHAVRGGAPASKRLRLHIGAEECPAPLAESVPVDTGVRLLQEAFHLTHESNDTVGSVIDVGLLKSSGFEWLDRRLSTQIIVDGSA